jgi:hypothetical protein
MSSLEGLAQKAIAIQGEMGIIKGQIKFFNKMLELFKTAEVQYPNTNNDANFEAFLDFWAAALNQECERLDKEATVIKAEDKLAVENYKKESK